MKPRDYTPNTNKGMIIVATLFWMILGGALMGLWTFISESFEFITSLF